MELPPEIALALLEVLPEGIAVVDARDDALPVVFVNHALAALRGDTREQLLGRPLAGLLGDAREAGRSGELKSLLARGEGVTWRVQVAVAGAAAAAVTEVQFLPVRASGGEVTHYLSVHRLLTAPAAVPAVDAAASAAPETRSLPREDRLTGLAHAEYFHELYRRDFSIAQREGRSLVVFLVDMDGLEAYNATFGRQAGDSAIRRVGRAVLSGMRRGSDLMARVEGGRFVGLSVGLAADAARRHGETLAARVRELHMHHPRSQVARFITVSVGVAQCVPTPQLTPEVLLEAAQQALDEARAAGRNRVALRSLGGTVSTGAVPG